MLEKLGIVFRPGWPELRGFKKGDGWLIAWSALMLAIAGLCVAIAGLESPGTVQGWGYWGPIFGAAVAAYVSVGVLLIERSWEKSGNKLDEAADDHPSYHAAFGLLFLALCIMAGIAFEHQAPSAVWPWDVNLQDELQRDAFFVATACAFIPLLYGFHKVARETSGKGPKRNYLIHPEGPVGWPSLLGGFGLISLVGAGAWAAGEQMFSMEQNFGLVVMTAVVAGFLAFIFVPHLGGGFSDKDDDDTPVTSAGSVMPHPGYLVSGLDAAAVRLLAPLSGATQTGRMIPQLILTLLFLPLSAMGYALPAPWGLVPIGIAAAIIFGLGRRWAWVEDDREKALRIQTTKSDQFRLGFANDLRDEALMGYLWLFILVPLALRQVQLHFDLFEAVGAVDASQASGLVEWVKFFGTELAKGVPIVDWVDIYDVNQEEPFAPKGPLARHIVFVSRLLVDVVIIAALLQAFGIMQRNRAQEKLFESGQIDFFDPFMERRILKKSFRRSPDGTPPLREQYLKYFRTHKEKSKELDKGDYFYNTRRLNELYNDKDPKVQAVVRWFAQDLIVGTVTERLQKLADLYERASAEARDNPDWTRKFYRFFDDVVADGRNLTGSSWKQEHSIALSRLLFQLTRDKEYDQVRNRAILSLGKSESLHAARALAARLVRPEHAVTLPGITPDIADTYRFARQPRLAERSLAIEALFKIKNAIEERTDRSGTTTLKFIEAVLDYVRADTGNSSIPT